MPREAPVLPKGPLPSPEEAASLLQQQTSYINQIEAENRYMKVRNYFLWIDNLYFR